MRGAYFIVGINSSALVQTLFALHLYAIEEQVAVLQVFDHVYRYRNVYVDYHTYHKNNE